MVGTDGASREPLPAQLLADSEGSPLEQLGLDAGSVWVDRSHFQNPKTDVSYLIRENTRFKQVRLFMFSVVSL